MDRYHTAELQRGHNRAQGQPAGPARRYRFLDEDVVLALADEPNFRKLLLRLSKPLYNGTTVVRRWRRSDYTHVSGTVSTLFAIEIPVKRSIEA